MKEIFKKFNQITNISILSTVIFCIIGIVLMVYPATSLTIISYAVAILFMASGLFLILRSTDERSLFDTTTIGVCVLIPGIVILIHPALLVTIIPIVIGMWIIVNSVVRVRMSLALKDVPGSNYAISIILGVLEFVCGILLIINPQTGSLSLTSFMGIMLLIYSISDFIDMVVLKKNVNDIKKSFKELAHDIEDAKYTEETKKDKKK